jgi:hypothetical protein
MAMRHTILATIIGALLLNLFIAGNVRADSADQNGAALMGLLFMFTAGNKAEETRLERVHQAIDKDAATRTHKYIQTLARRFQVPTGMIEKRRNKEQGWGEVTTELVMAQDATRINPDTYPTLIDGLKRIEDLRSRVVRMGWEKIAQELRLDLRAVRSAVENIRNDFRSKSLRLQPKTRESEKNEKANRVGSRNPLLLNSGFGQ